MHKAGYEWDAENKQLRKIEQNPTWSEEDEQYLLVCKNALSIYQRTEQWDSNIISHWLENKLKSLKPQNTWKPSDEQMHYLYWIANIKLGDSVVEQEVSKHLNELYKDLKNLKG